VVSRNASTKPVRSRGAPPALKSSTNSSTDEIVPAPGNRSYGTPLPPEFSE